MTLRSGRSVRIIRSPSASISIRALPESRNLLRVACFPSLLITISTLYAAGSFQVGIPAADPSPPAGRTFSGAAESVPAGDAGDAIAAARISGRNTLRIDAHMESPHSLPE